MVFRYLCAIEQRFLQWKYSRYDGVKVLMFHQVSNDKNSWINESLSITEDHFIQLIKKLQEAGALFVSVNEIADNICKKAIAITFDDVYADAYIHAIHFLRKEGIPYTVFICECFIDKQGYISSEDIEEMIVDPLCTIGYHSKDHLMMRNLDGEQIKRQIDCKGFQKEVVKREIDDLAFPYGSVYAVQKKAYWIAIESRRYKRVFCTISAPYSTKWRRVYGNIIPRINVNNCNWNKILER